MPADSFEIGLKLRKNRSSVYNSSSVLLQPSTSILVQFPELHKLLQHNREKPHKLLKPVERADVRQFHITDKIGSVPAHTKINQFPDKVKES